ncbi:hypothetical protein SODALDRAFT_279633 [Sodiomyces alkalinus F11]|uniref:HCP-like protein n=1 Tax=Sodiomyces alkalinus (strain CBS 110278 / VKM F-3762 / F11) TaxID=1314773 RepID=A0A3N2PS17_SODAK|nr:hypothetical protein SODALDRAFT_279633 [Sodiomyces alkalinus F11]ROT37260.1 hypothetical protein SODALDRAFT_279633 [Sodiomyces alkalinus F11]
MAQRPGFLDLRSKSSASNVTSASKPLRSPRLHVAGEVPPELSPLDAFAMQSRLLARQLQDTDRSGRRMSRLPPLTPDSPLIVQGRSEYFRFISQDSFSDASVSPEPQQSSFGFRTEVDEETERPKSMHPRMSCIPSVPDEDNPLPPKPLTEPICGRQLSHINENETLFGARREQSPGPMESAPPAAEEPLARPPRPPSPRQLTPFHPISFSSSPEKLTKQPSFDGAALAPPRPSFAKRPSAPSSSSSPLEPAEEDNVMSASVHSPSIRKLSSASSAFSSMHGGSPALGSTPFRRSASMSSEASLPLPPRSFNFSRPLSRAGTPGPEAPSRQASSDSQPSFVLADDAAHTPVSMTGEGFPDRHVDDGNSAAPSYIYSKFSLPRGKSIQRSDPMESGLQVRSQSEQPTASPNNVQSDSTCAPPSPPTRPSSSSGNGLVENADFTKMSLEEKEPTSLGLNGSPLRHSSTPYRPSTDGERISEDTPRGRSRISPHHDATPSKTPMSVSTPDSTSKAKPSPSLQSVAQTASGMTAEEHLAKGIECHENSSVQESTYHFRHAAKLNHPTGMLLYALACRHGWGMKPNQQDGVEWLRKAAESVSLEIADDEGQIKDGKHVDVADRRTRKAQFALSIYELGVSHMNGWGIEQDKALALRCFEIAGSWGDADALAEAGYCYAKGIGRKKNLKKAAKFYREAEAKGMNMVGNSWIHKAKYKDDEGDAPKAVKKSRSKSRTRSIFGKKTGGL